MIEDYETITVTAENIYQLTLDSGRNLRIGDQVNRRIPITDVFSTENQARRMLEAMRLAGLFDEKI